MTTDWLDKLRTYEKATQWEWSVVGASTVKIYPMLGINLSNGSDAKHIARYDPPTAKLICDVLEVADLVYTPQLADAIDALRKHLEKP